MSDPSRKTTQLAVCEILRNASLLQTQQYSGCNDLQLQNGCDPFQLGQVLSTKMTLIVVSGKELKILFKMHFNSESTRQYLADLGSSDPQDISDAKVIDYMKELINRACGSVCRILEKNEISVGMSIPLCVRGFYEVYSDYAAKESPILKFGDCWQLNGAMGSIYCSCYVEIMDEKALAHVKYVEDSSGSDEMEFL